MKTCRKCGTAKPRNEFHDFQSACKACRRAQSMEIKRARRKAGLCSFCQQPPRPGAWTCARHLVTGNMKTRQSRWLRAGLRFDLGDYERLFASQGGACAICRKSQPGPLDVDHDHATGVVRGLLCRSCNLMLGKAFDDTTTLRRAADYLSERRELAAEAA